MADIGGCTARANVTTQDPWAYWDCDTPSPQERCVDAAELEYQRRADELITANTGDSKTSPNVSETQAGLNALMKQRDDSKNLCKLAFTPPPWGRW